LGKEKKRGFPAEEVSAGKPQCLVIDVSCSELSAT
jgi:hypothetical protein